MGRNSIWFDCRGPIEPLNLQVHQIIIFDHIGLVYLANILN